MLRLVFPPGCVACDRELDEQTMASLEPAAASYAGHPSLDQWCQPCLAKLISVNAIRCPKCAAVLARASPFQDQCASCLKAKLPIEGAFSINNYEGILQALVIKTKNYRDEMLAWQLGRLLSFSVQQQSPDLSIDLVVPIPSHWRRQVKSGFHAAYLIAESFASERAQQQSTSLTTRRALKCIKATKKQGTLSVNARISNVRGVFRCVKPDWVKGRKVLLIDDVMTTGATISEASKVLRRAGAESIHVAVVARATGMR